MLTMLTSEKHPHCMGVIAEFTVCQQVLTEMKTLPEFMLCLSSLLPGAFPPRGIIGIRIFLSYN